MGKSWVRSYLMIFGGFFSVISVVHLTRFFVERPDIWWTPKPLAVQLTDSSDRVEVYVREALLQELLRAGRLQLSTDAGLVPLAETDVRLRFNNWDRVRVERLPAILGAAAGAGASGVLLLIGILGWVPKQTMESPS